MEYCEAAKPAMMFAMKRYLLLLLLCVALLFSSEIRQAQLTGVIDNGTLVMDLGASTYICSPYGIRTLEALENAPGLEGECRNRIARFGTKNPLASQYAHRALRRFQFYRIEPKKEGCVLYGRGRQSYAEGLLQEGLAVVRPGFDDREWAFRLERAQQGAKETKRGIWSDPMWEKCAGKMAN